MKDLNKVVKSAITGILALSTVGTCVIANNVMAAPQDLEKCYGIAKANKNDCQTSTHSCAGTAAKDSQGDAFILVPKGVCEKIAGGSLTMKPDDTSKPSS